MKKTGLATFITLSLLGGVSRGLADAPLRVTSFPSSEWQAELATQPESCPVQAIFWRHKKFFSFAVVQQQSGQLTELVLTHDGRCMRALCPASQYETVQTAALSLPTFSVVDDTLGTQQSSLIVSFSGRQVTCPLSRPHSAPETREAVETTLQPTSPATLSNVGSIGHP